MSRRKSPLKLILSIASLLLPLVVTGQEPPPAESQSIKVIVWSGGRWIHVESVEERNGSIIYQKPGGRPIAAEEHALDKRTTLEVNLAFETFFDACAGEPTDLASLFELSGRSKNLFFSIAGQHDKPCLQRLHQDYERTLNADTQLPKKRRLSGIAGAITIKKDEDGNTLIDDIPPATPTPTGGADSKSPGNGTSGGLPTYIKSISADHEGSLGLRVYVTLGNEELEPVAAAGELKIHIQRKGYYRNSGESYYSTLLTKSWFVGEEDFKPWHGGPRFDTGRISFEEISHNGKWTLQDKIGRVMVSFRPWMGEIIVGFDEFAF